MLALKKARSNPQTVGFLDKSGPHTSKPRKRYLQQLEGEVNKSRIAIDNMSHTCAIENSLVKKVEELQKELHLCIMNINQESQRQRTLVELTAVLRGQMNEVQAVQRNEEEYESNTFQKKSKKVEYDIKQILHKYNQEVAKINSLKEEANAARDERVVYSNLFNKIEKEIKHYEQVYKQTVIKNEICIDKKRAGTTNNTNSDNYQPSLESLTPKGFDSPPSIRNATSRQGVTTINELSKAKEVRSRQPKRSIKIDADPFLTNIKDSKSVKDDTIKPTQKEMMSNRSNDSNISTNIEALIRGKQADIDKIIMAAECNSMTEVLQLYETVQQKNDEIKADVQLVDERIALVEEEIERIKLHKRTRDIEEKVQVRQEIERNSINLTIQKQQNEMENEPNAETVLMSILNVLNLNITEKQLYSDEVMRQIDHKIDNLGCCHYQRKDRKDSKILSAQDMNCASDRGVCQLLQKIQKFNESERLLDRTSLKLEYTRELSKVRKKAKKII